MAKLLAVNWRDIRDPDAGGAEVHLHEILKRMVVKGHEVTWFSCRFPGSLETETYDGIRVIRAGNWFSANYTMPFAVRSHLSRFPQDLVIDDINKVPFFLPAFTPARVLAVVPHLFGTTVFRETNPVFASYVWLWERFIPWAVR